jgi:dihydrofolate reductase
VAKLRFTITMSLDGFVAGPDQSVSNPLGVGGERLHEWLTPLAVFREQHGGGKEGAVNASSEVVEALRRGVGATIMGRNMFGGGPGPWNPAAPWPGWWGDDPPFHHPVFVLTHHAREPLPMEGGTTFHFVTDGIHSALAQARAAAGDRDVTLAGGADAARQYLAAGLVDEMTISLVPVLLGRGERLFTGLAGSGVALEQASAVEAPGVTHIAYRVRPQPVT